jgi:hypothetical protein
MTAFSQGSAGVVTPRTSFRLAVERASHLLALLGEVDRRLPTVYPSLTFAFHDKATILRS